MVNIRVLLADDQSVVRVGLRGVLENSSDITVIAEATNGAEAVSAARMGKPDVALIDVRMPIMDGLEATRQILADDSLPDTRVVVLTTFELDEYVFEALRAGASGFLSKDIEPLDLRKAIRVVASGESLLSPRATRSMIEHFLDTASPRPTYRERLATLTARELEIMSLVAAGLSNTAIGQRLVISPETARTHVHRAMSKLGVRDRAELVVLAYETGLVRPGHV